MIRLDNGKQVLWVGRYDSLLMNVTTYILICLISIIMLTVFNPLLVLLPRISPASLLTSMKIDDGRRNEYHIVHVGLRLTVYSILYLC
jgi:hypothetical protein